MGHEQLELGFETEAKKEEEPRFAVEYLTIAECALIARCHERTIRRAIECGELRAGRIRGGGSTRGFFRIRRVDLDSWIFANAA